MITSGEASESNLSPGKGSGSRFSRRVVWLRMRLNQLKLNQLNQLTPGRYFASRWLVPLGGYAGLWPTLVFALFVTLPIATCEAGDEVVVRWTFSRNDDLNFDNIPDGWKRTYDAQHPRYLKLNIVPHDPEAEISVKSLDGNVLDAWFTVRDWSQRLPFQQLTVQSTPSLLPLAQLVLRRMPPLPPSFTDMLVNRYLRAEVDGGAIMASSSLIPVDLDYSYRLQARIRTEGLTHNRAWLELIFASDDGKPIEILSSKKFGRTQNWTQFDISPNAPPRKATNLQVVLRYEPEGRADLTGWVGFDDIVITRFPRMRLETDRALALYDKGDQPQMRCVVSGIDGDGRAIEFQVLDEKDNVVQTATKELRKTTEADNDGTFSRQLVLSSNEIGGIATWSIPGLKPGYYRVRGSLAGVEDEDFAVEQTLAILNDLPAREGPFGWSITGKSKPVVPMRELPDWLQKSRVQWLKYGCWISPKDLASADDLAWLAGRLQDRNIEMVGVLDFPPQELLAELSAAADDPIAILFRDSSLWQPLLEPVMTRLTSGIHWWQLGGDRDHSFLGRSQLKQVIGEIHAGLQGFGQPIEVAISWPWLERLPPQNDWSWHTVVLSEQTPLTAHEIDAYFQDSEAEMGANESAGISTNQDSDQVGTSTSSTVVTSAGSLFTTASFRPEELAQEIADDKNVGAEELKRPWIILDPLNKNEYSRTDRIGDLVRRMVAVRRQKVPAAFVSDPFDPNLGLLRSDGSPDEMLLPWRTSAALLAGMYPVGSLEMPQDSENILLADADSAMLVVWSDRPRTESMYLGENARQIDAFGRDVPIKQVMVRGFDVQQFMVTPEPSFIINVDRTAALWRLGVRLDRERIDSLLEREQSVKLIYQNPSTQNISGNVRIETPDTWNVSAAPRPISVEAFRRREEPITILLRGDATIGRELLAIDFELDGEIKRRFTVWRPLEVGPEDIKLDVTTRMLPDGRLLIRQEITNAGASVKQFDCYVYAPGRRRQRRSISVQPGQTQVQEFVWLDGESLIGQELLLKAEQQGGDRTLNYRFKAAR